ncbi:MAG: hypothetical protein ACK5V3_13465 [Bdellovibrionales bacterium]
MGLLKIDWTLRSVEQWRKLMGEAHQANWMQTWSYAEAHLSQTILPTRMISFNNEAGEIVAIAALQRLKLGPIQFVQIQRGPLWLNGSPTEEQYLSLAKAIRKEFPKSPFTWIRWLPEFNLSPTGHEILSQIHFQLGRHNFQTLWLDLSLDLKDIRQGLDQKWRNLLNKSEKLNVEVKEDTTEKLLKSFLNFYDLYKSQKNYKGPSKQFLNIEFWNALKSKDLILLWAFENGIPCAGIALHMHGPAVSYRASWNSAAGRKNCAHYALLWKAIQICKIRGLKKFDLGGVLPDEAPGLSHFKNGLNGQSVRYDFLKG